MSKTFKSAWPNHPRKINVREIEDGVNVRISDPQWDDKKGITLAPSDAPALALAILEAAGYSEDDRKASNPLYVTEFASAIIKLAEGIEAQERATAEAEAQAKLEAEALRLANEFYGTDWDYFPCSRTVEMQQWLAVARRARDINKEGNNA